MTNYDFDRRISAVARRQHGVFSNAQVRSAGGSDRMIARRLACGRWTRLYRGVYALASSPSTFHRALKAAELSKEGAAVSGKAAALDRPG
jgi:hypothetical protein